MNRQIKGVLLLVLLGVLGWSVFEWDRQMWRPERMRSQATLRWDLDQKRLACFERPDSLVILGNSILHTVRDSLEALPGVAVWSVPGEYVLHLDKWSKALLHPKVKVVAIALGANDLLAGWMPDTMQQSFESFRIELTAAGKHVYRIPVVPFELAASTYVRPQALAEQRAAFNRWPKDTLGAHKERSLFPAEVWKHFTADGVHPNEKGRALLSKFYKSCCLLE